jgi:hypothetical protein
MPLHITRRVALLGNGINTRAERHGEEHVAALEIPVAGIMLAAAELATILRCDDAVSRLFREVGPVGSRTWEPAFPLLRAQRVNGKAKGAAVTVWLLDLANEPIKLADCTLAKLILTPLPGGYTELALTVQTETGPIPAPSLAALLDRLGAQIEIAIEAPDYFDQRELPLEPGPGTPAEDQDDGWPT